MVDFNIFKIEKVNIVYNSHNNNRDNVTKSHNTNKPKTLTENELDNELPEKSLDTYDKEGKIVKQKNFASKINIIY